VGHQAVAVRDINEKGGAGRAIATRRARLSVLFSDRKTADCSRSQRAHVSKTRNPLRDVADVWWHATTIGPPIRETRHAHKGGLVKRAGHKPPGNAAVQFVVFSYLPDASCGPKVKNYFSNEMWCLSMSSE
jgi:hypothetical protein